MHVLEITICAYLLKANRKIFLFCLFNSLGPASLVEKKEKVGWSAIFHFFFPRAFPRDFYSFVVSRHVVGASPMMKVGFHTIGKVMGGRETFKPQEFFSLSNSLYEFFLGHSMKFWGGNFSHLIFPIARIIFFVLRPFSNGPSDP